MIFPSRKVTSPTPTAPRLREYCGGKPIGKVTPGDACLLAQDRFDHLVGFDHLVV
jgi:hypothetical protein